MKTVALSRNHRGFTLLELLITITVIGVLASIALPAYRSFVLGQRVKTASFDVVASMILARSEAIKQNGNVTISPVGGSWVNGWTIVGPDGVTISTQAPYTGLLITGPTNVIYGRDGRVSSGTGNLEVDDASSDAKVSPRCITIGLTGQPVVKQASCS